MNIQRAALGLTQGYQVLSKVFLRVPRAMLQLLYSQAREKLQEELLKRNKQNLYVRPNAALCMHENMHNSPNLTGEYICLVMKLNELSCTLKAASVVIKGSGDMIVIGGLIDDQRTTTSDRSGFVHAEK